MRTIGAIRQSGPQTAPYANPDEPRRQPNREFIAMKNHQQFPQEQDLPYLGDDAEHEHRRQVRRYLSGHGYLSTTTTDGVTTNS
jgi:hypothetical protein